MCRKVCLLYILISGILFFSCGPEELTYDEAVTRLDEAMDGVLAYDNFIQAGNYLTSKRTADLASALPDINTYSITVEPYTQRNDVVVEIFVSTEKSGTRDPDNWLVIMAEDFNSRNIRISNGKTAKIRIRKIASGTGYQYIASGKYIPDAFSPSNQLWINMVEASGLAVHSITDELVGNTAGIVMKTDNYNELKETYGNVDVKTIINAVAHGDLSMGYTNPFASSTGLNFLATVLTTFADGDENIMLSEEVVSTFEAFQMGVPFVSLTTLQMRDSVKNSGSLEAFVMEHQTYIRTDELGFGYEFIPFGIKHSNPLYAIGNISDDKIEVLEKLAEFLEQDSSKRIAYDYGFNRITDYTPKYSAPSGEILIQAQLLWKEKKDSGRPIVAVFVADVSGSMGQPTGQGRARTTPLEMLKIGLSNSSQFINEENYIGLIAFNHEVERLLEIKRFDDIHASAFEKAIRQMRTSGQTAMFDGIAVALDMLVSAAQDIPNCKPMIFVLTDGETNSGYLESLIDIYSIVDGLNIPIYTIGYNVSIDILSELSIINEAANLNANSDDITFVLGTLLNAEM